MLEVSFVVVQIGLPFLFLLPRSLAPSLSCRMRDAGVGRRWVEEGLIGLAGADSLGHSAIDFQNDALGAVLAVSLLVFALDGGGNIPSCRDGIFGNPNCYAAMSTTGNSSHVRPSRRRPARFLFTPPHCLKKKDTPESRH